MINVKNLRALSDMSRDYLIVKWEIDDTSEDLSNYKFNVYRMIGTNSESEKELIESIPGDAFELYDLHANSYKRNVQFYYVVEPTHIPTGQVGICVKCTALYDKKKDVYANYIRHVNNVYLKAIGNDTGNVLIKKRFGQKCSICWDDIRRQHRKHNCPSCFGTGYEGGYNRPHTIKFSYMSATSGISENIGMDGRSDNNQDLTIWTESYPLISVGDVFIDENNDRFKVNQVQRTTKNNEFVLRQVLNIQLLSPSDPVYDIIIDIGGEVSE